MLDVHPPHSPIHGWRDFLIQLFTITVGLLIALALEGGVEWLHHRHVMHQAQSSLYIEIKSNAAKMQSALDGLHLQQAALQKDVTSLNAMIAHPEATIHDSIDIRFSIKTFASVSWKTAQATGALAYMPYDDAQLYSDMYLEQNELEGLELQAARDTTLALAPLLNLKEGDPNPSKDEALAMKHQVEVLQGQLMLVDTYLQGTDQKYRKFLAQHLER